MCSPLPSYTSTNCSCLDPPSSQLCILKRFTGLHLSSQILRLKPLDILKAVIWGNTVGLLIFSPSHCFRVGNLEVITCYISLFQVEKYLYANKTQFLKYCIYPKQVTFHKVLLIQCQKPGKEYSVSKASFLNIKAVFSRLGNIAPRWHWKHVGQGRKPPVQLRTLLFT